jgi:hypothetical protein
MHASIESMRPCKSERVCSGAWDFLNSLNQVLPDVLQFLSHFPACRMMWSKLSSLQTGPPRWSIRFICLAELPLM